MKIGFVLDDTLDSSDGVQQYVLLLGSWLQDQGHDVHYITGESSRQDIVNVHSLSRNIKARFNKNRLSIPLPTSEARIKTLLVANDFDILHVQMPYSPMMAGKVIMQADSSVGIIATYHIAPHSQFVTVANKLLGLIQKRSIKRLDRIVSVSPVAQAFAKSVTKQSSTVIPNAIDTVRWQPKSKQNPKYDVVFIGRLVPRKGCIYLLKAINQIVSKSPEVKLRVAIAGTGPEADKLRQYVANHKLQKYITFKGYVSEDEKRQLLQSTRLAVFPSTGGESFGIVLLEAMAAGAVTLAGDNDGYRSVIGPAEGSLIHPQDTVKFTQKISELLENTDTLHKLGVSQQKLLKQFDIENVGNAILAVYKDTISLKGTKTNVTRSKNHKR